MNLDGQLFWFKTSGDVYAITYGGAAVVEQRSTTRGVLRMKKTQARRTIQERNQSHKEPCSMRTQMRSIMASVLSCSGR